MVDEDIDPKDPDMVMWAISFAMQPHRAAQVITGRSPVTGTFRLRIDEPSGRALLSAARWMFGC